MTTRKSRTACMMRCRNEGRWIRRSLERTFAVAGTVVVWDDGSVDDQRAECLAAMGPDAVAREVGGVEVVSGAPGVLHYVHSPFHPAVRDRERVNEIRDKNLLYYYCKARVDFDHMLCMDGDEVLSLDALRNFDRAVDYLEFGVADVLTIPFVYLWDSMAERRTDGLYGDGEDGHPRLRFPRLFTVVRMSEANLF